MNHELVQWTLAPAHKSALLTVEQASKLIEKTFLKCKFEKAHDSEAEERIFLNLRRSISISKDVEHLQQLRASAITCQIDVNGCAIRFQLYSKCPLVVSQWFPEVNNTTIKIVEDLSECLGYVVSPPKKSNVLSTDSTD